MKIIIITIIAYNRDIKFGNEEHSNWHLCNLALPLHNAYNITLAENRTTAIVSTSRDSFGKAHQQVHVLKLI